MLMCYVRLYRASYHRSIHTSTQFSNNYCCTIYSASVPVQNVGRKSMWQLTKLLKSNKNDSINGLVVLFVKSLYRNMLAIQVKHEITSIFAPQKLPIHLNGSLSVFYSRTLLNWLIFHSSCFEYLFRYGSQDLLENPTSTQGSGLVGIKIRNNPR